MSAELTDLSWLRSIKRHIPLEFVGDWQMIDRAANEIAALRAERGAEGCGVTGLCATCRFFWAWARPEAKQPLATTRGDCERFKGRMNGIDRTFGCRAWAPPPPAASSGESER